MKRISAPLFRRILMIAATVALIFAAQSILRADDPSRWTLRPDGVIEWKIADSKLPHDDHLEASGEQISTVLRYGVAEDGSFHLNRSVVWPMLRTIPNNTHASLTVRFEDELTKLATVDGAPLGKETVDSIELMGILTVRSKFDDGNERVIDLVRKIFPSTTKPVLCERLEFKNAGKETVELKVDEYRKITRTPEEKGVNGSYSLVENLAGAGEATLKPGEVFACDFSVQGYSEGKGEAELSVDFDAEEAARRAFVDEVCGKLVLDTPEPVLNAAFAFSKIRASESIYRTKGGLMHGPGGESYYAAIWANDQAEYVNPFFPFLGYRNGDESALNSYLHFARFMNDEFKPIPSSIIAEGIDIWNGAGDRGDAAMIAYGAARYALARADRDEAKQLWPLIEWCLEYCKRKLTSDGVVASRCDELEGRFPAGNANLCTSTLYYDALTSAVCLGRELEVDAAQLNEYAEEAKTLRTNINSYFGANVAGFETYRYYDGCAKLRSWICIPLVAGITERADGTIAALFSDRLWTRDGLLTEEGSKTFWDRSTLYALRGVLAAGATEKGLDHLRYYSKTRLLGEHVPYPIEAWPEGRQRHLSAESGLYCRIYTEGLFGIRPTGFGAFDLTPRLPTEWKTMSLKNIRAFGRPFDLTVSRADDGKIRIEAKSAQEMIELLAKEGETVKINFNAAK